MKFKLLMAGLLGAMLVGCGGGGGSATTTPAAPTTFTLTAKVDGTAVAGVSVTPGGSATIALKSGQALALSTTEAVNFTATLNGATSRVNSITSTLWDAALSNPTDTTVSISVALTNDTTKNATITVNLEGQRYAAVPVKLNDSYTFGITTTLQDNTTSNDVMTRKVTTANPDNTFTFSQYDGSNTLTFIRKYDANGNLLSFLNAAFGGECIFAPLEKFYDYPLYVGKSFTATWTRTCGTGPSAYFEDVLMTASVEAYESITVPAGTFNTLRIKRTFDVPASSDANVVNFQQVMTCWINVANMKTVKCTLANTYAGIVPGTYVKTVIMDMKASTVH